MSDWYDYYNKLYKTEGTMESYIMKDGKMIQKEKEKKKVYKGKKNETEFPFFVSLLQKTQIDLKKYLRNKMEYFYVKEDIFCEDGYLYVKGKEPVCLVAHMDTTPNVGGEKRIPVVDYYEETTEEGYHILSSPQGIGGDDRCGIYTILSVLKETEHRPYIVFCEDEEIGCVGSGKFAKSKHIEDLKECKFLVEIDRRGNNDAVFYDDCNEEFHKWIEKITGYKEASGTCSDICELSEACKVSSVNLSSGYYNEHTLDEVIIVEETFNTIDAVIALLDAGVEEEVEQFEYTPKYSGKYSWWWNDDDDDDYYGLKKRNESTISSGIGSVIGYFVFENYNGVEEEVMVKAESKLSCIGKFFLENSEICWADVLDYYFEEVDY